MCAQLNIITPLHKKSPRNYVERMISDKVRCSEVARQYGFEYWDGDRKYGYGGYRYDGRWSVVAKALIDHYKLPRNASILDVGCGKGFLLYELQRLLPEATLTGIDISEYALQNAKDEVKPFLRRMPAQEKYPFGDKEFDLVFSNTTLHNLCAPELAQALMEIERVGKNKYVCVESYRSVQELFNLQCWALTCETFFAPSEWAWFFGECGYTGDHEFIFFE